MSTAFNNRCSCCPTGHRHTNHQAAAHCAPCPTIPSKPAQPVCQVWCARPESILRGLLLTWLTPQQRRHCNVGAAQVTQQQGARHNTCTLIRRQQQQQLSSRVSPVQARTQLTSQVQRTASPRQFSGRAYPYWPRQRQRIECLPHSAPLLPHPTRCAVFRADSSWGPQVSLHLYQATGPPHNSGMQAHMKMTCQAHAAGTRQCCPAAAAPRSAPPPCPHCLLHNARML